jgi:tripartite-type tricarboxylate transporter receptor subunit TctC
MEEFVMTLKSLFTVRAARLVLACACVSLAAGGHAQSWPAKPVKVISPYGAGGSNDVSARIIAEQLETKYGHRMLVENKPGAGTRIANETVARSPADGYTLLWAAAPFAIAEAAGIPQRYDIKKDFVPVGPRVLGPLFLTVNADSPVRTVADFVKMAREKKDGATFASPGIGSGPHLTAELFGVQGKFKVTNVHYRGDAAAYADLVGGRVDAALTAVTTALPFIKAGKLRVIAVASAARTPVFPEAPTFGEGGYPGVVGYGWFGFVAPAGTPQPIVQQINRDANAVLSDPAIQKKIIGLGLQPVPGTSDEFGSFIAAEVRKWASVIKTAGIVIE